MPICPYKINDENETITLVIQNTLQITFLMPWTSRTEATRAAIPPTRTAKHFKSCNKTTKSKSKWMHSLTGDKKQDIIVLDRLQKDDFEDVSLCMCDSVQLIMSLQKSASTRKKCTDDLSWYYILYKIQLQM
jgi:hypothetical protein